MTYNKNNSPFKVITGGLSEDVNSSKREFAAAYVTDTRLMGVVGMYVHWYLPDNVRHKELYQLFYFDAEEHGFDNYKSLLCSGTSDDAILVAKAENTLFGGLGGKQIYITEEEACFLVQKYAKFNEDNGIPMPDGISEYKFMLERKVDLSSDEEYALMCKQCTALDSPYQVINYFLMRCYGKDFEAAKALTKGYVRTNIFPEHKMATFLRNNIEEAPDDVSGTNSKYFVTSDDKDFGTFDTFKSYMCESLIEYDGKYFLIVTQVTLDQLKVVKYEKVSTFKVTTAEASMMTSRGEFVTVCDLVEDAPDFNRTSTKLTTKSMVSDYDNGKLFMIFHPDNDHVKKKTYSLNDDVKGIYYLVDDSQLILASYSLEGIRDLEADLAASYMSNYVVPVSKYEFKEPVLFEFMNSVFDDFEDFVETIALPGQDLDD